jgi:hypothetical protein
VYIFWGWIEIGTLLALAAMGNMYLKNDSCCSVSKTGPNFWREHDQIDAD